MNDAMSQAAADAAAINEFADGSRARPYATPVAFAREVGEVAMSRPGDLQRDALKLANRLSEKYGRNRDGFLFVSAIGTIVAALARDMARRPMYGGEPRVQLPQPMVDGKPRSEFIENMLIDQAEKHADAHRQQEPGDSVPPSGCRVCGHLRKLSLPVATDDEVGAEVDDAPAATEPAVLIVKGQMDDVRAVLRAVVTEEETTRRYSWYTGGALQELRMCDRNELFEILFGGLHRTEKHDG
jgi:hypothetical protein